MADVLSTNDAPKGAQKSAKKVPSRGPTYPDLSGLRWRVNTQAAHAEKPINTSQPGISGVAV